MMCSEKTLIGGFEEGREDEALATTSEFALPLSRAGSVHAARRCRRFGFGVVVGAVYGPAVECLT